MGFTTINQVMPRRMWSLPKLEFGPQAGEGIGTYPGMLALTKPYALFVSAVDADGNEVAGIRLPDIAVPLATHTGWNEYAKPHPEGELCDRDGTYAPFSATRAEREAKKDPRLSLEERYGDHAGYVKQFTAATEKLVAERLLREMHGKLLAARNDLCGQAKSHWQPRACHLGKIQRLAVDRFYGRLRQGKYSVAGWKR